MEGVVEELNRGIAAELGYVLELVRWETHARPGIGTDAQAVINGQLPDPDIVIGFFWKRLGSPTPRADSGTAEEIDGAIARWTNDDRIELLVYFNQEPYSPHAQELAQIEKLFAFKAKLADRGVLYWEYTGADEFEDTVRQHLTGSLRSWGSPPGQRPTASSPVSASADDVFHEDIDASDAPRVDALAAELRASWLAQGITRRTADRAATVLLELLANVRDHALARTARIEVEMPPSALRCIRLRIIQQGAGPELVEALPAGWAAYEDGSREHGLVKTHRLASHLDMVDDGGHSSVECTLFDCEPIGSGVFEEFGIPAFRIEYDVPRRCWLGDNAYDMAALKHGVGWALHQRAARVVQLYLGGLDIPKDYPLGIEVTGNILPSEISIEAWPTMAGRAPAGARSISTLEAGLEIAYLSAFERGHVIFHAFETGMAPKLDITEWAARWDAPVFTSVDEVRTHLEATTGRAR